ncbi:MAG: hypothetical protein Q8P18_13745 [Pseudomonadota bacterium]|nr:hypothetical protein [Pseudomonadota bacterium]
MTHISTLRLHQLRLGELDAHARAPIDAHLAGCELCAGRLGHQDAQRAAFVRTPIPAGILPRPTWWERLGRLRAAFALVPVLAAALLVVTAGTSGPLPSPGELTAGERPTSDDVLRTKGAVPLLEAWVKTGDSARPLYTGERVRGGTRVQLKYDAGKHRFVTIAGRDGHGTVEVYGTLAANGPGLATAPFALTLDDTKGEQAFFAILTDTRPAPDSVLKALAVEPIRMDSSEIASVVLRKE